MFPDLVYVHEWWNTTYPATVETVITQWLQYNNTIVPNTTTLYNPGATSEVSAPTIFPGQMLYGHTTYDVGTVIDLGSTIV